MPLKRNIDLLCHDRQHLWRAQLFGATKFLYSLYCLQRLSAALGQASYTPLLVE